MEKNEVGKSFNYEKFKTNGNNRDVRQTTLARIDKSVKKNGWLKHPIIVNENYEIQDGQHRYIYAKEHDLPVYYVVVPGLNTQDCLIMNNARTSWSLMDYIKFYAKQGNDNYVILLSLAEKYSFIPPSTLANIIRASGVSGSPTVYIKEGKYVITTKEYQEALGKLEFLDRCKDYIFRVPGRPSSLLVALSFAYDYPEVDNKRLEKQVKSNIGIITPPATTDMALKEIEYLYNYNLKKGNYVYIYTEYKKVAEQHKIANINALNEKRATWKQTTL